MSGIDPSDPDAGPPPARRAPFGVRGAGPGRRSSPERRRPVQGAVRACRDAGGARRIAAGQARGGGGEDRRASRPAGTLRAPAARPELGEASRHRGRVRRRRVAGCRGGRARSRSEGREEAPGRSRGAQEGPRRRRRRLRAALRPRCDGGRHRRDAAGDRGAGGGRVRVVSERACCRPASVPIRHVALRCRCRKAKTESSGAPVCAPAVEGVSRSSCVDVSFVAGMPGDRFARHLPPAAGTGCRPGAGPPPAAGRRAAGPVGRSRFRAGVRGAVPLGCRKAQSSSWTGRRCGPGAIPAIREG